MECVWLYRSILMLNVASMLIHYNDAATLDPSMLTEKRDHIGTEFYLSTTNNLGSSNKTLHITSESSGSISVSMTSPKIYEETALVSGYTQFNLSAYGYTHSFSTYSGIHIVSSVPVAIVVLDVGFRQSAGAFLALPVALSGTLFMAAAYDGYYYAIQCGIQVVATTDNTSVTLQDPEDNIETVQLNRLDKTVIERGPDITGTMITASKPVSVISGTRGASIPSGAADMLIEQMIPYDAWTDFYIVPPLHSTTGYLVRILSLVDQKVCFENKTSKCVQINRSSSITSYMFGDEPVAIYSNVPISVVQYAIASSRSGPFMNIVPGVSNYANNYKFSIPDVNFPGINHFVTLIILSAEVPGLLVDGSVITDDYMQMYNTSTPAEYAVLIMNISVGYHEIEHIDTQVRFGALAYGLSHLHSYGWLLGFTYVHKFTEVPYGHNCTINEDRCEGANTECNSGRCLCVDGYYLDGVECVSTPAAVPFGHNCTINEDRCEGANTECNSGRCLCVDGYYLDGVDCVSTPAAVPFGHNCTINEDRCEGANTECNSGRCLCVDGYYLEGVECVSRSSVCPISSSMDTTAVIVAACMGAITLVMACYATCVTVLLRRSKAALRNSNSNRRVSSTRVNGAFHSDINAPPDMATEDVRTQNRTIADESLYESLNDGYMDANRTYNIIRTN